MTHSPLAAGWKEGRAGHGLAARHVGEPLSHRSGFTELRFGSLWLALCGARGITTLTSGHTSKTLIHVTLQGDPHAWGTGSSRRQS